MFAIETTTDTRTWAQKAIEAKEQIWDLYRKHGTVERVAAEIGIPRPFVGSVIDQMPLRQIYRRTGQSTTYDQDFLKKCLREAAKVCGEPLTIPAYRQEAPKQEWPADLTITKAFGNWENACKAAGVKSNASQGPRRGAYTEEDCLIALRICKAEMGEIPSYEKYCDWAKINRRPSGATVRVKVGPWREALRKAYG